MAKANSKEECNKRHVDYEFDTLEHIPYCNDYRKKFVQENVNDKQKVLDIGCNSGNIGIWLPNCDCWGIDVAPKLVEKAKKRIKAQVAEAEELPFKNKEFEVAICSEMLEHVYSPEDVIKEAIRVANKIIGTVPWRKGLKLFKEVEKLPYINLMYNKHTFDTELPKETIEQVQHYYNGCDYVLITSSVEGGPMSLVEGLRCGKKVICPITVGNAELFKEGIIDYTKSDFNSLQKILLKLYNKKKVIANLVKELTWDNYIKSLKKKISEYFNI